MASFTIFLQEGYQYEQAGGASRRRRRRVEAIAAANLESAYSEVAAPVSTVVAQLPQLAYNAFAPFIAPVAASELIDVMLQSRNRITSR